jgi:hypothetical protein
MIGDDKAMFADNHVGGSFNRSQVGPHAMRATTPRISAGIFAALDNFAPPSVSDPRFRD